MTEAGRRYLVRVLSSALAVALLSGASAYSGHHAADVPDLLLRVAVVMVLIGACGAWLIFRPVERYLRAGDDAPPPAERIRRLPLLTGGWVFALAAATVGGNLGASHSSWRAVAHADAPLLLTMLLHALTFAAYIGLYVYFLIKDYVADLRHKLWRSRGLVLAAGRGRIAYQVVLGVAAIAAAPLLLVFSDPPPAAMAAEQAMHHALLAQIASLDLLASALFTVVLVVLVSRAISRPAAVLAEAMQSVDRGDVRARSAVVSDDEFGALACRFNRMLDALAERDRMRRIFGRLIPEEVAGALLGQDGAVAPQERDASVLFTDIERFTQIAVEREPREVLSLLNGYFDVVAGIIHARGGVITQFQGDAVLAVFNLPAVLEDHALRAVEAAVEIAARSPLPTRVGVSTGRVVGGTVAGGDRLGYTVHGDTVNLAARLEELNKQTGSRVLVDERTAALVARRLPLRDRGEIPVRGFAQPMHVFQAAGAA